MTTKARRGCRMVVMALGSVVGLSAVALAETVDQQAAAEEVVVSMDDRIGTIEYPSEVTPTKGKAEGLIKVALHLPTTPSDVEISTARIFLEPLIPVERKIIGTEPENAAVNAEGGQDASASKPISEGENAALSSALKSFLARTDRDDVGALDEFLKANPDSRWKAALQTNLGILQRRAGYFSEALGRLEEAWALGKSATTPEGMAQANLALGELADLNARFGRYDRMKSLFDEVEGRPISGAAQTKLAGAKEGYWLMMNRPGKAFWCGPYAVNAVLDAGKEYKANAEIAKDASTWQGTNLKQLKDIASRVGLDYVPAKRQAGAEWVCPAVVNWKVGHFAAVLKKVKGRYLVKDPTYGSEIWVSAKALDAEGTGYALIAQKNGKLPTGWVAVSDEDAAQVWGKGAPPAKDDGPCARGTGGCGKKGMAVYDILEMRGTLRITDDPVGYKPPVGPAVENIVRYNHLTTGQPANFTYANFGPFWMCNWVAYATVDTGGTVTLFSGEGGSEVFGASGYNPLLGIFKHSLYTGAVLRKNGEGNYQVERPDGSKDVYSQVDASTGRIFLKQMIDPQGNTVTLNYDSNLRLTTIVDTIGQTTTFSYKSDTVGNSGYYKVYRITDPFGRYAEFTYDGTMTNLVKIRDVIGIESSFEYAEDGFIRKMTTPYGESQFYQYIPAEDGTGRGLLAILPDGSKECLETYMAENKTTFYWNRKAMAMGAGDRDKSEQTHWLLSPTGSAMMDVPEWSKKALESRVTYSYDGQVTDHVGGWRLPTQVSRTVDGSPQVYKYEYNDQGRVTKTIDPIGRTFSYKYSVNNIDLMEVRQTRSGNNDLLAKFTYDSKHNPLTVRDANGRSTTYTYNTRGQVATVTNAKGEVTTLTYDTDGYLTRIDGPLSGTGDRVDATYDSYGRPYTVTSVQGPGGGDQWTATLEYDALDRLTRTSYPDGSTEQSVYSRLDTIRTKDRLGRWTQLVNNALGQVVEQRDPNGGVTKYEWCRCGALQGLTDPKGQLTKWAYDVQGRLIKKTYADSTYQSYDYENDAISWLTKVTDPAGNVIQYAYNLDNTPSGITYSPASGFSDVPDVTVTWDPNYRRVTGVSDAYAAYSYSYNSYATNFYGSAVNGRGRVSGIINDALEDADLSYEYDELGRMTKRQVNGSANESTWTYDAAGRASSWVNPLGTFTPTYQNPTYRVSRLSSLAFPNGQTVNYTWEDATGDFRLKGIENLGAGSTALSKFDYVTDAISRIKQWKQQKGTAAAERLDTGYNAVDELTSAVLKTDSNNAIIKQFYYGYDKAGNRTSKQEDTNVKTYTFNNLNQLTGSSAGGATRFQGTLNEPGRVTVGGQPAWMTSQTNFSADVTLTPGTNSVPVIATDASNKSRTNNYQVVIPSGGSASYAYDGNGNITSDGTNTYSYDALNRLVKTAYTGGTSTEYSYDALGRRVKIVEKSGDTPTSTKQFVFDGMQMVEQRDGSNTVTKRYYPEGWRDVPGGASYFYTKDHLGSIREVVDGSGALASRYDYDPYGKTTKVSGSVDSDMLYTGHYQDTASGLYLTMYRAYKPELARWLSRDPIGEEGGINLYGYVGNNPINAVDPLGLVDFSLFPISLPEGNGRGAAGFNPPDFFSVGAHGNPSFIKDQRNQKPEPDGTYPASKGISVSPSRLANMLRDPSSGWDGKKPVFLVACSTGKGPDSFAQRLADELGVDVLAPTENSVVSSNGNTDGKHTGSIIVLNGGHYKWFFHHK